MDALSFHSEKDQFTEVNILRELNKAYVGFVSPSTTFPIATGNWGCGAFKGNTHLKAIVQLMAAAEVGRELY
jgi:poly(ADP-ribose) glycohydrolase